MSIRLEIFTSPNSPTYDFVTEQSAFSESMSFVDFVLKAKLKISAVGNRILSFVRLPNSSPSIN